MRAVVRGKNILLAKHLLKESGFPDVSAIDLMTGVDLVGTAEKSPLFDFKIVAAVTTPELPEFLLSSAEWRRCHVEARDVREEDPQMARALWETTLKEVELGYLQGPFHELRQVQECVPSEKVICSRRFVILQGEKPRVIDDLEESGVNQAYAAVDRLVLHDIDFISVLAQFISNTIWEAKRSGRARVASSTGSVSELTIRRQCQRVWLHETFPSSSTLGSAILLHDWWRLF